VLEGVGQGLLHDAEGGQLHAEVQPVGAAGSQSSQQPISQRSDLGLQGLLIRKHLRTGEFAFHYCFVPEGQLLTKTRLFRAAGLRWPVEEGFEFGKDCFGLDQPQTTLYTAIARHTVLVCAALAVCAVTAALLRDRTDSQTLEPTQRRTHRSWDPAGAFGGVGWVGSAQTSVDTGG
jgi:hypothetical protein